MTDIPVTSACEFLQAVMDLRQSLSLEEENPQTWFFRGQKSTSWSILPNIFRNRALGREFLLIEHARRRSPQAFKDAASHFEILTKLQHYGLGTRLLDITANPLVALYFATEQYSCFENNNNEESRILAGHNENDRIGLMKSHDGCVYLTCTYHHPETSLFARVASSLAFLDIKPPYTLENYLKYLEEKSIITSLEKEHLKKDNYTDLINYLGDSYFIMPSHSNDRLIRQSGAFLISTAINITPQKDSETLLMSKAINTENRQFKETRFVISADNKEAIREELDFFNINESTLFPELEHQMAYSHTKHANIITSLDSFSPYSSKPSTEMPNDEKVEESDLLEPPKDNISEAVKNILPDAPQSLLEKIYHTIEKQTNSIDWNKKENIKSALILSCTKILQEHYPRDQSKELSNRIVHEIIQTTADIEFKNQIPSSIFKTFPDSVKSWNKIIPNLSTQIPNITSSTKWSPEALDSMKKMMESIHEYQKLSKTIDELPISLKTLDMLKEINKSMKQFISPLKNS